MKIEEFTNALSKITIWKLEELEIYKLEKMERVGNLQSV